MLQPKTCSSTGGGGFVEASTFKEIYFTYLFNCVASSAKLTFNTKGLLSESTEAMKCQDQCD